MYLVSDTEVVIFEEANEIKIQMKKKLYYQWRIDTQGIFVSIDVQ